MTGPATSPILWESGRAAGRSAGVAIARRAGGRLTATDGIVSAVADGSQFLRIAEQRRVLARGRRFRWRRCSVSPRIVAWCWRFGTTRSSRSVMRRSSRSSKPVTFAMSRWDRCSGRVGGEPHLAARAGPRVVRPTEEFRQWVSLRSPCVVGSVPSSIVRNGVLWRKLAACSSLSSWSWLSSCWVGC